MEVAAIFSRVRIFSFKVVFSCARPVSRLVSLDCVLALSWARDFSMSSVRSSAFGNAWVMLDRLLSSLAWDTVVLVMVLECCVISVMLDAMTFMFS